jgi:hypothetical protein
MNFLEKISYLCKSKETTKLVDNDNNMKDLLYEVLSDYGTACVNLSYYAKKCGYEYPETVDIGGWLKMPILVLKPTLGDIVVFGKDKPTNVGIFISRSEGLVYTLEVNNGIELKAYPIESVLGYRKLHKIDTNDND